MEEARLREAVQDALSAYFEAEDEKTRDILAHHALRQANWLGNLLLSVTFVLLAFICIGEVGLFSSSMLSLGPLFLSGCAFALYIFGAAGVRGICGSRRISAQKKMGFLFFPACFFAAAIAAAAYASLL